MKTRLMILCLVLTGCVTPPKWTQQTFYPKKAGVLTVTVDSTESRAKVTKMMTDYCAPQRANLLSVGNEEKPGTYYNTGTYIVPLTSKATHFRFECED